VVSYNFDGANMFQESKACVAKKQPWVDLAIQTLSTYSMVAKLENLLQFIHKCFFKSPYCHFKLTKIINIIETKGKRILRQVKTRGI
jgi:hypothetical protein